MNCQPAYMHNGQWVSAEAFYAIACDPRRSVAVEACAGAGKTWMLVSRIVRALLDGVDAQTGTLALQPHEILAITFTKRAASEMRERLYKWLSDFSNATPEVLCQELQMRGVVIKNDPQATSELLEQLSNLYKAILSNGRQVQVRTFHSWFAALLRSAPLSVLTLMELPANYELLEDDAPAKALVWRRFYAALVAGAADVGDASTSLKGDFEAVVLAYGRSQTEKALQTALDKRTEFALADAQGVVAESVLHFCDQYPAFAWLAEPDDFIKTRPAHAQTLLNAAKALGGASAKTFSAKGVELEIALTAGDMSAAFDALLTKEGSPRKFGEKISGIEHIRDAQDLVLQVVAARLQHDAWDYQQRMARLSRLLLSEYAQLKQERGWVDMNDVERAALVMLGDPVLSGWVQERLDARIKHLLIDEFQDTNPLQWQALRSWLSSYAGAGAAAPRVFLVGDPKQSIYRFRRAEPQVFKAAKDFVCETLGGDLLSCDHTRRNATGVIDCVNAAMDEAQTDDGFEGFRPHTTSATESGLVCHLPPIVRMDKVAGSASGEWRNSLTTPREIPEETLRTLEARQAAQWIAQHLQDAELKPQQVMVLSRKRAGLMPLQLELRKLNIDAQIGEKTALIDCCEVQDIVALLDVLVSPQHDLSLARVLKSPLFGMTDTTLVQLALAQQISPAPWFDLLQKEALQTPDGREIAPLLLKWRRWIDQMPPHDALQAIYSDGDVLARFGAAAPVNQREAVLANLRALLGVSLQLGGGRYATPYAFVRALKAGGVLAPATVNAQAIRLLTIHGAKGLEAETVLLLDTDTPPRNADTMGVLIDWPGEAAWPSKFVFLASESKPPACAVQALEAERLERQREELNALYVALTRARHTLAISSIEPYRTAEKSWWQRLVKLAQATPPAVLEEPAHLALRLEASFFMKELPEVTAQYAKAAIKYAAASDAASPSSEPDSLKARIGKALHRLLEWGRTAPADVQACAREFVLTPPQVQQALDMALRILQGEGAWAWNPDALAWQGNEVELIHQGQLFRLDRLVQRKDTDNAGQWWVLDYKSADSPENQPDLIEKMRQYRSGVQGVYPGEEVRCAFLTGQGRLIEVN
jgi:ATP-dependent helicase/nuclease subunit A